MRDDEFACGVILDYLLEHDAHLHERQSTSCSHLLQSIQHFRKKIS